MMICTEAFIPLNIFSPSSSRQLVFSSPFVPDPSFFIHCDDTAILQIVIVICDSACFSFSFHSNPIPLFRTLACIAIVISLQGCSGKVNQIRLHPSSSSPPPPPPPPPPLKQICETLADEEVEVLSWSLVCVAQQTVTVLSLFLALSPSLSLLDRFLDFDSREACNQSTPTTTEKYGTVGLFVHYITLMTSTTSPTTPSTQVW